MAARYGYGYNGAFAGAGLPLDNSVRLASEIQAEDAAIAARCVPITPNIVYCRPGMAV